MLGVPEDIINYVRSKECHVWRVVLSHTDAFILSLARAFIANPQVLCIHKPTLFLSKRSAANVLRLLRQFVEDRGLALDEDPKERQPRTVIFTSARRDSVEASDEIFNVSQSHGIHPIEKNKVTPEMLL
mmetsp:Transcript_94419/g.295433  ORF Transcript_94419/g.295433 Transcript_94419/m.295433 type:complete len:129 (+) Transcript_94419:3-389(+)